MKHRGRAPKRQPKYPWQRMKVDTPQEERDLIATLTQGLEQSQTIYEVINGLTHWLAMVVKLERAKQPKPSPLVKPTMAEVAATNQGPRIQIAR